MSERIRELQQKLRDWNNSGVSVTLAPWHDAMGEGISPYQKVVDELRALNGNNLMLDPDYVSSGIGNMGGKQE